MLRSLFSGVSGLRNHQLKMDVIGNNIANINTVGFKAGRARFSEAFSQVLQGASPGNGTRGGTNPVQVGMGVQLSAIDNVFTQGGLETTGLGTDLALQGDGFFMLSDGKLTSYTRDGAFSFDGGGNLVDSASGSVVQGYAADANGNIAAGTPLTGIKINLDSTSPAKPTSGMVFHGNLDASAATGTTYDVTSSAFDSLGNKKTVTLEYKKTGANTWDVDVTAPVAATDAVVPTHIGTLTFKPDGSLDQTATGALADVTITPVTSTGADPIKLTFARPTGGSSPFDAMTQTTGESTAFVFSQDGYAAGNITKTSIDQQGHIVASFSNGVTRNLAQIAVARFANSSGLTRGDGNAYTESLNSGRAVVGQAGSAGFGSVTAGALEGSNVDLAQEFTDLIVAQRGFQANARVITTGDEMLTEVVNIKR